MISRFTRPLLALAASLAVAGAAHAATLVDEGFDDISTLAGNGWVMTNLSTAGGTTGWFQGSSFQFAPVDGGADSFIAANYNNAPAGGMIDNWLISPTFSTATATTVSFWAQGAPDAGYADLFKFGVSTGSSATGDFVTGAAVTATQGAWTQYTFSVAAHGAGSVGRFAIEYTGPADSSDYLGIDRVTVASAPVPEPATNAMFGLGLLGLFAAARRRVR